MPREITSVPVSPYELLQARNRNPPSGASAATVILDSASSPLGLGATVDINAESFGASASATAAVNTVAIQAALSRTGLVSLTTPGTYLVNKTLSPKSYTRFYTAPGVILKLAPSSNCNIIRNWFAQNGIDPTTSVSIASLVATITEAGHSRSVGDQVYIEGCLTNTTLNGLQTVASVNGSAWTCAIASSAALTNTNQQYIFIGRYNPLAGSNFTRATNVVTVTETGHTRQVGDHVYVAGTSGANTFNGAQEITGVTSGTSWTYANTGANESATGTAQLLGDTSIDLDLWQTDYDVANNSFTQLGAVNVTLGNIGNSTGNFNANIGGRSRAVQLFNAGFCRFPKAIAYGGKGTFQIESACNQIHVGHAEQQGGTDDVLAWGVTLTGGASFGATASPSGAGNMGVLVADYVYGNCTQSNAGFKIFASNGYDLGSITCKHLAGPSCTLAIGDSNVGTTGTIQEVIIGRMENTPASSASSQCYANAFSTIGKFSVSNVYDNTTVGGAGYLFDLGANSATFGTVEINLVKSTKAHTGVSIIIAYTATINNLFINGHDISGAALQDWIRVMSTATVTNVHLSNNKHVPTSDGAGNFIAAYIGGTIGTLNISNFYGRGRAVYWQQSTGSATTIEINASNVSCGQFVNDGTGSQSGNVRFSNLKSLLAGFKLFNINGSGTWNIKGSGVTHASGDFATLTSGTVSVTIDCPEASIDVSSSKLVPAAGNVVLNSSATAVPGTGLVQYDGTSWRAVVAKTQIVTPAAAPALNCNLGSNVTLNTSTNATVTWGAPTNVPPANTPVTITITQDSVGGRNVVWNAAYIFPTAWTNTGNTANLISEATFVSNGTKLIAQGANVWHA